MEDQPKKTATYRKLGDKYHLRIPGQPSRQPSNYFSYQKLVDQQLSNLRRLSFELSEYRKHLDYLDDRLR